MTFIDVLTFIGGLSLFLYGMKLMGDGFEKQAGYRMKNILEKLTSSPLKGVLIGALITAIIQSSSATTVMVVGFVNSGLMKISQATGVIMGANIGTTITAWILSLTGIRGDSFFIQLLKPSSFTPVLALIGIIFTLGSKNPRKKNIGTILLGFAVLMFGMETMSGAVKPLREVPEFTNILLKLSNPLLGIAVGAIFTCIIQSSSASIGILQALALATGAIPYQSAIPILLGMDIGTCITAMLSSIGANRNARTAALVHLYFNIIGVAIFLVLFNLLNLVFRFDFLPMPATPVGLAMINSLFKVFAVCVLFPFSTQLQKLAAATVEIRKYHKETEFLDRRLLSTPSIAVERCRQLACDMARDARDALLLAINNVVKYNEKDAETIRAAEEKSDMYEDRLGNYLVELSSHNPSKDNVEDISMLLHIIGDLERISDHSVNIMEVAEELHDKKLSFSEEAQSDIKVISAAVEEILKMAIDAFCRGDTEAAKRVEPLEQVVDELCLEMKKRHVLRLQDGRCTIELGFILADLLNNLERVADHCSNVALGLIEISRGNYLMHEYARSLRYTGNEDFKNMYEEYREKYNV
ncbi:MAG TPA: Na/Pi cotransporter family protein [Clostridiales bacterium]|jgi:phosphate:Na+ symporter|nr:Na/Pi cotransporter family protein [Clostridiales bacterium]